MADEITNKELVAALRPMYGQGPSIGLKLLWQEALSRLEAAPDATQETAPSAPVAEATEEAKPSPPSLQTQVSGPVGTGSADEAGAEVVIASDDPIKDMPLKLVARANIRMGRTADGKSRP